MPAYSWLENGGSEGLGQRVEGVSKEWRLIHSNQCPEHRVKPHPACRRRAVSSACIYSVPALFPLCNRPWEI